MAEMLNIKKIKQQANYLWRVGATGFSFASFGVGGVVIGGVLSPIVNLSTKDKKLRSGGRGFSAVQKCDVITEQ